ncbi:O-antigen ligase family protein [Myroides injenensis]|uniref:O-antigen ligase family protein n=1 Tax=Myroides injenensis TaxID=1183151 RepID=UPI000289DEAE|nr:O-antigen ligase family protein [Myroides injenensis]
MKSNIINKLLPIFAIFYIFFVTFGLSIVNIALAIILGLCLIDFKVSKDVLIDDLKRNKLVYLLIFFSAVYQILIAALTNDLGDRRIGYLVLQVLSIVVLFRIANLKFLLNTYLLALTCLVVLGCFNMYQYYISTDVFNMNGGGHINKILVVARPYLGFILNIGILCSLFLFKHTSAKFRYIYAVLPILYIIYMIIISIRIQLLSLFFIAIIYFLFYYRLTILKKIAAIGLILMGFIGLMTLSSNLQERFAIASLKEKNVIEALSHKEPRVTIWGCTFNIINQYDFNPVFGIGNMQKLENKLVDCYDLKTINNPMRDYFLHDRFNTHNQFLEYYVLSGVLGLLLLVGIFSSLFYKVRRYFIPVGMLLVTFNFFLVENLFDRQIGTYYFTFTLLLILRIYYYQNTLKLK